MPTDIQSLLIYLIVLVAGWWLMRNLCKRGKKSCGSDCGCGKSEGRHPTIQKVVDRQRRK